MLHFDSLSQMNDIPETLKLWATTKFYINFVCKKKEMLFIVFCIFLTNAIQMIHSYTCVCGKIGRSTMIFLLLLEDDWLRGNLWKAPFI